MAVATAPTTTAVSRPAARRGRPRTSGWGGPRASQLFLVPIALVFVVLFLIPLGQTVYWSFTDFTGYSADVSFVGLENYRVIMRDPSMLAGLGFTLLFAVGTTVLVTAIADPLAVILNKAFVGRNFVRSALFFPAIPSMAVLGLVWSYILSPIASGALNTVLNNLFGLGPVPWLSDASLARLSVDPRGRLGARPAGTPSSTWPTCSRSPRSSTRSRRSTARRARAVPAHHAAAADAGHRRQPVPADDRRPQGVRPALHADQRRTRVRHVHDHPVDHHVRRRAGPLRARVGARRPVHARGGRPVDRAAGAVPPRGEERAVTRLSGRTLSVVMIAIACLVALPLYYIVVNTFKTQAEMVASPIALPSSLNLQNYIDVFNEVPLARSFANTLYVTVSASWCSWSSAAMAAYGMIMRATRFNRILGIVLVLAFVVPAQSTLIPLYRMLVGVNQVDTLNGLVIMYAAGAVFCFFLIQGYMRTLPSR